MKTKEELNALKKEVEALNKKLAELSEDELKQVTGGVTVPFDAPKNGGGNAYLGSFGTNEIKKQYDINIYNGTTTNDFEPKFDK